MFTLIKEVFVKKFFLVFIIFIGLSSTIAFCDCELRGNTYSEGSKIGSFKCFQGSWEKIKQPIFKKKKNNKEQKNREKKNDKNSSQDE